MPEEKPVMSASDVVALPRPEPIPIVGAMEGDHHEVGAQGHQGRDVGIVGRPGGEHRLPRLLRLRRRRGFHLEVDGGTALARELENALERAAILSTTAEIEPPDSTVMAGALVWVSSLLGSSGAGSGARPTSPARGESSPWRRSQANDQFRMKTAPSSRNARNVEFSL